MRVAMALAAPLRVRPAAAGAARGGAAPPALRQTACARRCAATAPRPRAVLRLRACAPARAAATTPAAVATPPPPHPNAEPPPPLLPRLAAAARAALATFASRRAAAATAAPFALAGAMPIEEFALDMQILWNKALLLPIHGKILLFLAISFVIAVWLIVREGMIQFSLQCEFALDELRRTRPDLPPLNQGWRFDWKEFIEKDWKIRQERNRFEAIQNAARAKELGIALGKRRAAEAQVAASVAARSYKGAERVAEYLRVQKAALERRRRRLGMSPTERFIQELDRELGLLPAEGNEQQEGNKQGGAAEMA